MTTMDQAWAAFDKALSFDQKRLDAIKDGKDGMARIAHKAVDKNLDEAVRLEAEALTPPEAQAA